MKPKKESLLSVTHSSVGISIHKLFIYYFDAVPSQLDIFGCDGVALYKTLRKKHAGEILLEFEAAMYDIKKKENEDDFFSNRCLYSTKEMIVSVNDGISYLYVKEKIFSKEKLLKLAKAHPAKKDKKNSQIGFGLGNGNTVKEEELLGSEEV
ncbi:MAG: hypothetical protein HY063_11785 [Bacteroidetes bacterium]|nr:hypothetical protein [Bacteroidota bacterium]